MVELKYAPILLYQVLTADRGWPYPYARYCEMHRKNAISGEHVADLAKDRVGVVVASPTNKFFENTLKARVVSEIPLLKIQSYRCYGAC